MADEGSTVIATISSGKGTVAVPDVSGQTEQEAVTALTGLGLTVNPTRDAGGHPAVPAGSGHQDRPRGGRDRAPPARPVTLFVSTGNVAVPDVSNMPKQQALDTLNAQKLTGNTSEVPSDQAPGTVIAQDQAPGTLVKQGRTINLQIAVAPHHRDRPERPRGHDLRPTRSPR